MSTVESQSTAGSTAIATSATTAGSSDPPTVLTARQPPIGIETAAATNPTLTSDTSINTKIFDRVGFLSDQSQTIVPCKMPAKPKVNETEKTGLDQGSRSDRPR